MTRGLDVHSTVRGLLVQLLWMGPVLLAFIAFKTLGGPHPIGEWFGQFFRPGP